MAKNRYIGEYPVIGIRPIIDGRRGPMQLRESLEDQVMAMAEAAKKLFEENLYYSNGEPVKVVMADTSIGRVPESAACAEKFKREGVAITLSVTPCWCYGSETMDMDPMTIKGVWGFNGTERPGAVYLASVLATHAQKGLPAFGIYGHEVQDRDQVTEIPDDVKEKLLRFGSAAVAVATMRGIWCHVKESGGDYVIHDGLVSRRMAELRVFLYADYSGSSNGFYWVRFVQTEKGDRARDIAFYEAGSTYDPSFDATSDTEVFLGWYTESGELLTDLTATENRTVYAQWESDFYD